MITIFCGRGEGTGLKIHSSSDPAFTEKNKQILLQLAELQLDHNKLTAVLNFDNTIVVIYAKKVINSLSSNPLKKQELRPYAFSQIFVMDINEYALEFCGRMACSNIEQYLYQGTDHPLTLTPEQLNGAAFLQAPNQENMLLNQLTTEEKLQYAYIGILFYEGKLNYIPSKRFHLEELFALLNALLPSFINKRLTYVNGGKINASYWTESVQSSNRSLEDEFYFCHREDAKKFFQCHPNLAFLICSDSSTRRKLYEQIETFPCSSSPSTSIWDQYETVYALIHNVSPNFSQKIETKPITDKKNKPTKTTRRQRKATKKKLRKRQSIPTTVPVVYSNQSSAIDYHKILEIVEQLLTSYNPELQFQFSEQYMEIYRTSNMEQLGILQNKIRKTLICHTCNQRNRQSYLLLLAYSCEIYPEIYVQQRRKEQRIIPIFPIDLKLAQNCAEEIFKGQLYAKQKEKRLLHDLKEWIWKKSC